MEDAEQQLLQRYLDWDKEIAKNNVAGMSLYMADDWTCVSSDGITSREKFLESIADGSLVHTTMSTDFTKVKIYGDSAVVIGKGISAGTFNGATFSLYEWSTNFFLLKNNSWICVLTMLTPATS